jgi:hypothetical protein
VAPGEVVTLTYDFVQRTPAASLVGQENVKMQGTVYSKLWEKNEEISSLLSNPRVYRIRNDVLWEDVICSSSPFPVRHFLNGMSLF